MGEQESEMHREIENVLYCSCKCNHRKSVGEMATKKRREERLVWIDCEMTGLDAQKDTLLEVAVIVTEGDLSVVAEGPNLVIHQPDEELNSMNEWCIKHHGDSGLTKAVRESKLSMQDCERQLLSFVSEHTPRGACPLAGNSVGQDAKFLSRLMPQLMEHLHYRIVDVSTIKELVKRWAPEVAMGTPEKKLNHRALDDIRESIEELRFYKETVFK